LITFIELIKNPRYNFWRKSFIRSAPEMERVFESIARSCLGPAYASVQQLQQAAAAQP
jgi:CCR4-NOT transcription complex subunit 1